MGYKNRNETPRREKRVKELLELQSDGTRKIDKYIENSDGKMKIGQHRDLVQSKLSSVGLNFVNDFMSDSNYVDLYHSSNNMTDKAQKEYNKKMRDVEKKAKKYRKKLFPKQKKQPKEFKIRTIQVKRKGKTYKRTLQPKWKKTIVTSLTFVAKVKPRSKEYSRLVNNLVKTTGRTRQAVVKKIQRFRKQNKKTIKSKE